MALTCREAFKYGFLLRCADENLTPQATEKRAAAGLQWQKQADGIISDTTNAAKTLLVTPLLWSMLASLTTGAGGGLLAANTFAGNKLSPPVSEAANRYKTEELINQYRAFTERAKERAASRAAHTVQQSMPFA